MFGTASKSSFLTAILMFPLYTKAYFIPFIIALIRDVRNKVSVFFLNLFLGWTVVGFFVLLFYASLTNATSNVSVVEFVEGKSKRKTKK